MKNGNFYTRILQLLLQPLCFIGRAIAVALISGYRYFISPLFPASCRFYPTCSAYASEAFKLYGIGKGFQLTVKRILKCHPWHNHSTCYDPVPVSKKIKGAS